MEWSIYESVADTMSYLPRYIAFQECSTDFLSFNSSKCILAHLLFFFLNLKLHFFFKYTKAIQAISTQHSGYEELEEESSMNGMRYKGMFWDATNILVAGYMHIFTLQNKSSWMIHL